LSRQEFPTKIKDKAFARAAGKCQKCGVALRPGKIEYDHILPDALGGKPELSNCQCVCQSCHKAKTATEDVPRIRKADRQRRAHVGANTATAHPIKSRGFAKTAKAPKIEKKRLAQRALFN
jgi:5-methylcytosine-specific restriction endonuclease McrA